MADRVKFQRRGFPDNYRVGAGQHDLPPVLLAAVN